MPLDTSAREIGCQGAGSRRLQPAPPHAARTAAAGDGRRRWALILNPKPYGPTFIQLHRLCRKPDTGHRYLLRVTIARPYGASVVRDFPFWVRNYQREDPVPDLPPVKVRQFLPADAALPSST